MMKRLFLIIAFWAAGVAGASAQMRLTLPQALDLALSENPTVKVAEMEVQRYDYVKRQTWGNLLPQISASGSYTRSIVKSEMRGGISFGADNTFAVQGDLSLPLFAPSVYRTLKMNDAQMATAVEAARASRIDLTAEVKKASTAWCGCPPSMPTPGGRPPSPRWRSCPTCPRTWRSRWWASWTPCATTCWPGRTG